MSEDSSSSNNDERVFKATFFVPKYETDKFADWLSRMPVGRQVISLGSSQIQDKEKKVNKSG